MNATASIKAYSDVRLETSVPSADPHKLILLLYQGALLAVATARNQVVLKEVAAKGASITKAITIIDEGLKACLDRKAGGDIAKNLSDLYDYMCQRLLIANLKNDVTALDEVSRLLSELKGAWEAIRPAVIQPQQTGVPAPNQPLPAGKQAPASPHSPARNVELTYGRI
jgi:flagellar protein FliS